MKFQAAVSFLCDIIIVQLNINAIRNKFELPLFLIGGKFDIVFISESKIDGTFLISPFLMSDYSNVYRLNWNDKRWGIVLFIKDNLAQN